MEASHACPYCGKEIASEEILFWTKSKQQFDDPIRAKFLRDHGVTTSEKFPRLYFKSYFDGEHKNVIKVDCNEYYPTMLEDVRSNGMSPKQLAGTDDSLGDSDDDAAFDDVYTLRTNKKKTEEEKSRIVQRACPHCHCELPQGFGILPVHHVAMFGIRAAGKTAYLVNLFQQINTQLGYNNLGSVMLAEDSKLFLDPLIKEYENSGNTKATTVENGLLPIVCQYKNEGKEAFIVFYDIAGEGVTQSDYMVNHKGIQNCETLLMMIDPNMLNSGAFAAAWKNRYGTNVETTDYPTIDAFLNEAGINCQEFADHLKSIVCVMTKMDMVLEKDSDLFGGANSKLEITTDVGKKHLNHVNMKVLAAVRNNLDTFLKKRYSVDLSEKIHNTFGKERQVYLLGVSTSTRVPSVPGVTKIHFEPRNSANDPKHRIIEPFLVIAMNFGLVSGVDSQGNVKWFTGNEKLPERDATTEAVQEQEKKAAGQATKKKRGFFSRLFGGKK